MIIYLCLGYKAFEEVWKQRAMVTQPRQVILRRIFHAAKTETLKASKWNKLFY